MGSARSEFAPGDRLGIRGALQPTTNPSGGGDIEVIEATRPGPPEVLVRSDRPLPEPGRGQLRFRTAFTSVNHADIKARRGEYPDRGFPFVPGLDASGIVDVCGAEVEIFRPGDRVAAYTVGGSYAEYVLADERMCFLLPDGVSLEQGAGIGVLITAYNTLTLAGRLAAGERVLIHAGAGGVGSALVRLAGALGAGEVFATVGGEEKAEVARELGADHVIDYRAQSFDEVIDELTGGVGVDLILDSAAGANAERGLRCLAPFGRLVIYGHTGGGEGSIGSRSLHASNRAVIGYSSGGFRRARPEMIGEAGKRIIELLAQDRVGVLLGGRFALEDAAEAQRLVENRASVGKILLEP